LFQGQKIIRQPHEEQIRWFGGEQEISNLPIRPRPEEMDDAQRRLIERGEKHFNILKARNAYMYHTGNLLSDGGSRVGYSLLDNTMVIATS